MSDVQNKAQSASTITMANATAAISEIVRSTCGNDNADPDVRNDVFLVGLEETVAARLNSRLAVKPIQNRPEE